MRLNKLVTVFFTLYLTSLCLPAQSIPTFRFTERPGPYAVGLKVVEQYDDERFFGQPSDEQGWDNQGGRARPLQTLVWYPARRNNGNGMTVGDYGKLLVTETNFTGAQMPQEWKPWIDAMAPTLRISCGLSGTLQL